MAKELAAARERQITVELFAEAEVTGNGTYGAFDIGAWASGSVHVILTNPSGTFRVQVEVSNVDRDDAFVPLQADVAVTTMVALSKNTKFLRLKVTAGTADKMAAVFHGTMNN